MPVYEYACKACGQHLEVAQSFKDEPLTTCPTCGGALRKVFGSIGISFKGSGFYRTDSRMAARKDSGEKADAKADAKGGDTKVKAETASGEKAGSGDSSKSESKAGSGNSSKSESKSKADAKTA